MKKVILLSILCVYAQSCPTLCDLLDCSPPGSSVHGISRARILEWVAIPYSRDLLYNLHSVMIHCLVSLKHPPKKKGELSSQASLVPPGREHGLSWLYHWKTGERSCCSEHVPADGRWEKGARCRAGRCWSIQSTAVGEQNAQRGWWDPEKPPHPPGSVHTARRNRKSHRAGPGRGRVRGHDT